MSDTPIDDGLDHKSSTRKPDFLADRIEEFRIEYNQSIEGTTLDDALKEDFLLTSKSQARRRLLDMGLAYFVEYGVPFGFTFDPETTDSPVQCTECNEDDPGMFRLGASVEQDDGEKEIVFDTMYCLSCESKQPLTKKTEAIEEPFGFDT